MDWGYPNPLKFVARRQTYGNTFQQRVPTYRRHDPGRDGSVPLVLVGKPVVGMKFPANPDGDADDHGGYLKVNGDIFHALWLHIHV